MEKKRKKIPFVTYLCYLLAVSMLFTGVTFSRYTGATSGNSTAQLARFTSSFEITDISAASFLNGNFWLEIDGNKSVINPTRSVRYVMRNYTLRNDGAPDRVSDIALSGTMRLYFPAEFAESIALQVVEQQNDGSYIVRTPQYVLRDFIYDYTDTEENPFHETKTFSRPNGGTETIDTGDSADYGDRTEGTGLFEEEMTVSGHFTGSADDYRGNITATNDNGSQAKLSITASMQKSTYSVGFARNRGSLTGETEPVFYLDCRKNIPFYTIDISLPQMHFEAGKPKEAAFVLFLTVFDRTENDDFNSEWNDGSMRAYLEEPDGSGTVPQVFHGAEVIGYHFERKAPLYTQENGTFVPLYDEAGAARQTTIRVTKSFDFDNGGSEMSYQHIAPLSEATASVVHSIGRFYDEEAADVTENLEQDRVEAVHGLYGACSNFGDRMSDYIYFDDIPDSPFCESYTAQIQSAETLVIGEAISKGYETKLNVLFLQASET